MSPLKTYEERGRRQGLITSVLEGSQYPNERTGNTGEKETRASPCSRITGKAKL